MGGGARCALTRADNAGSASRFGHTQRCVVPRRKIVFGTELHHLLRIT